MSDLLDRPIAFHRVFVRLTGSVTAAVMLSQALYWSKRTKDAEGWFWKTREEWEAETGLTRREQETARRALRMASAPVCAFWQEEERGMPSRLWYKVDSALLMEALSLLESPALQAPSDHASLLGGNVPTSRAESAQQEGTNRTNKKGGNVPTSRAESAQHYKDTETTSENTTETTTKRAPSASAQPAADRSVGDGFLFETWFETVFWPAYPNKAGKAKAKAGLHKIVKSVGKSGEVMVGLTRWLASHQWAKDGGAYIPHGSTWVNQQAWLDEPESQADAEKRLATERSKATTKPVDELPRESTVVVAPKPRRPIPPDWFPGIHEEEARHYLKRAHTHLVALLGTKPTDEDLLPQAREIWRRDHLHAPRQQWEPEPELTLEGTAPSVGSLLPALL